MQIEQTINKHHDWPLLCILYIDDSVYQAKLEEYGWSSKYWSLLLLAHTPERGDLDESLAFLTVKKDERIGERQKQK